MAYKVKDLKKVNVTRYIEGDIFYTDNTVAMLINGKMKRLISPQPNIKDYVKKTEVKKMIEDVLKGDEKNE